MKLGLVGYGRMGRAIEQVAIRRGHEVTAVVDGPALRSDPSAAARIPAGTDAALEFTAGPVAERNVRELVGAGIAAVCGTTGWRPSPSLERAVADSGVGVVLAPNFSVGVHLFYRVVREAARVFGAVGLHEPWLLEHHHRGKKDAPSGTARRLAEIVIEEDPRLDRVHAGGLDRALPPDTLHVASVRGGHAPGTHALGFDGEHDTVTLTHRARSRTAFALGAVLAAEWLPGRHGLFGFEQVLDEMVGGGGVDGRPPA